MPSSQLSAAFVSFAAAAAVLTVTPGADTALVLRTAMAEGSRRAVAVAAGVTLGVLVWGVLVSLGVAHVVNRSPAAFAALTFCGSLFLLWMGIALLSSRPDRSIEDSQAPVATTPSRPGWFMRGLLTNLLNPKVGIFYMAFLPPFVPKEAGHPALVMSGFAAVHAVEGAAWFAVLIHASARLPAALRSPGGMRWLNRVVGALFVGLALVLAFRARAAVRMLMPS